MNARTLQKLNLCDFIDQQVDSNATPVNDFFDFLTDQSDQIRLPRLQVNIPDTIIIDSVGGNETVTKLFTNRYM